MIRIGTIVLLASAISLIMASCSMAFLAAPLDLGKDASKADVICTGTLVSMRHDQPSPSGSVSLTAEFLVDRVSKGDVKTGDKLTITWSQGDLYLRHLLVEYDLLLVKRRDDGYTFALPALSSMRVPKTQYKPYVRSSDVMENLHWEVTNGLQDSSVPLVAAALDQTSILTEEELAAYVTPLVAHPDPGVRALALSRAIDKGDLSLRIQAVQLVVSEMESGSKSSATAVEQLKVSLERTRWSDEQLPSLQQAIGSKSVPVRQFASLLMRRMGSPATSDLFAALSDADLQVRYNAVMGLADVNRDFTHAPAFNLFEADPKTYVDYWLARSNRVSR